MPQRLAFAQKYCGWTTKEWERVVWTDESTFEVGKILDKFMFGEMHMSAIHQVV